MFPTSTAHAQELPTPGDDSPQRETTVLPLPDLPQLVPPSTGLPHFLHEDGPSSTPLDRRTPLPQLFHPRQVPSEISASVERKRHVGIQRESALEAV